MTRSLTHLKWKIFIHWDPTLLHTTLLPPLISNWSCQYCQLLLVQLSTALLFCLLWKNAFVSNFHKSPWPSLMAESALGGEQCGAVIKRPSAHRSTTKTVGASLLWLLNCLTLITNMGGVNRHQPWLWRQWRHPSEHRDWMCPPLLRLDIYTSSCDVKSNPQSSGTPCTCWQHLFLELIGVDDLSFG